MSRRLTVRSHTVAVLALVAGTVAVPGLGAADTVSVSPGPGALGVAIARAQPGDILLLSPGTHDGRVVIDRPLTLDGRGKAEIRGTGEGSTITVGAGDVIIRGLKITGSGGELETMDSGVFVNKKGHRALVEGNTIEGNLFGVYLWGPKDAVMRGNTVIGRTHHHVNQRGNGVSLWNTPGSIVEDNTFLHGRDGIFTTTSKRNIFRNNRFKNTRIAVHYMYTNDSIVSGNVSEDNNVGYALMYSKKLTVTGNVSRNDRDHGILLNYANGSIIDGNLVDGGRTKCVFIYNSNKNTFRDNRFENCPIGIHFTAGSERNGISGNAFIANRTQVKYVGTRNLDWSEDGRGNYWSDNTAFDMDGNGIADTAYRPNDMIDKIVWAHPTAKLLLNSPAVQVMRWAQSQFPALRPGGVVDTAPLMQPPAVTAPEREGTVQ